jgi:hypothetical protein
VLNKSKKNKVALKILFSFLFFFPGWVYSESQPTSHYSNNPVVAEVDDKPIYLDDLKHIRIQEALMQLHQMQTRALKEKILENLAKKHPEFSTQSTPTISEAEVKKFYDNTPGIKEMGGLQQVYGEIEGYLRNSYRNMFIEQQFQRAVKQGWAKVYLTPPNDFHLVAGIGSAMLWS